MKRKIKPFNVINFNFNSSMFEPYDVMPYFINEYKAVKTKPETVKEFTEFVKSKSLYQFWGRCEYEVVLHDWPCDTVTHKMDVHEQLMMNLDIVVSILMENVRKSQIK